MTRPNGSYDPPGVSIEGVQRILGRGRDASTPRGGETWEAFVRRKSAPHAPGWWSPFAHPAFRRALEEALARGEQRRSTRALVLPF